MNWKPNETVVDQRSLTTYSEIASAVRDMMAVKTNRPWKKPQACQTARILDQVRVKAKGLARRSELLNGGRQAA